MEQYRVLLADDEAEIRQGISRKIDWAAQGFVLAGEAENGAEALELAEQIRPDVVLTDIKMPFMDGLELCRRLRRELPAAKLVVFSGFDDFEYARQAVSMGVSEYIMKPVNARELEEVLAGLRTQLEAQRQQRRAGPSAPSPRARAPSGTNCCFCRCAPLWRSTSSCPAAGCAPCFTTMRWPCWRGLKTRTSSIR